MTNTTETDTNVRGLFDDFGAFRTPTTADFDSVLTNGLVTPDANVLLNLYRYTEQARADLLAALGALGDRLWIPHQVLVEFWRNRETTISEARSTSAKAAQEMSGHSVQAVQTLRTWANRVALSDDDFEDVHDRLSEVFEEVRKKINEVGEGEWQHIGHDTSTDPVIAKLEPALTGRVGPSFSPEDRAAFTALGQKRVDQRVPPGYMDAKKDGNGAVGDFFVWEQLLREASRRQCDVLFVTADAKEDWWRKERGPQPGPATGVDGGATGTWRGPPLPAVAEAVSGSRRPRTATQSSGWFRRGHRTSRAHRSRRHLRRMDRRGPRGSLPRAGIRGLRQPCGGHPLRGSHGRSCGTGSGLRPL